MWTRRILPPLGTALATLILSAVSSAQDYKGQTLRVATFGGTWQQWAARTIEPVFTAKTGAKVEFVPGAPPQHLASLVAARGANVPFDVAELSEDVAEQAAKQQLIVVDLNTALIPNLSKVPPEWRGSKQHGPMSFVSLNGLVYDADKFAAAGLQPPTTWDALADPKLAGRVALPDITFVYRTIYASINELKTGDQTNLDGSLAWVRTLARPVIYGDFPTLQTRFGGGEVWAVVGSAGYVFRLTTAGRNLKFVMQPSGKDRVGSANFLTLQPVKGSTKAELAHHWINAWLSTEVQLKMVQQVGFAPTNLEAAAEAAKDPKVAPLVVSTVADTGKLFIADAQKINAVFGEWVDKWNRVVRR